MNKISILIPTFGQWHYTELCLTYLIKGLQQAESLVEEIVIVDTVPPVSKQDCTQEYLQGIPLSRYNLLFYPFLPAREFLPVSCLSGPKQSR